MRVVHSCWAALVYVICLLRHLGECKPDQDVSFDCGYLGHVRKVWPHLNQQLHVQKFFIAKCVLDVEVDIT